MLKASKRIVCNHGGKALIVLAAAALLGREAVEHLHARTDLASVAAWSNIGGCGSSGGGAAAGAGKWVGRGVSGGLVDLEMLNNLTVGPDYSYEAIATSFTFHWPSHPTWTAAMSTVIKDNTFEYEGYLAAEDIGNRLTRQAGGFGDLGLSLNHLFGNENEHSVGLSLSLPTGQHDIKRLYQKGFNQGADDVRWLNPFVQPGSGLYNLGVSYEYTKTKDWGLVVWGASYTSAWAWDNWGCRDEQSGSPNDKMLSCQAASPSPLTWKLWELQHQDWGDDNNVQWVNSKGAPGTGATGADNVSFYGYIGHSEEASTQNVGLTLSIPLSPTYYWDHGPANDIQDRVNLRLRNNDYTLKLSTGLEITNPNFPLFLSVGIPYKLNDIISRGRLTDPMNYVATVGMRGTFF